MDKYSISENKINIGYDVSLDMSLIENFKDTRLKYPKSNIAITLGDIVTLRGTITGMEGEAIVINTLKEDIKIAIASSNGVCNILSLDKNLNKIIKAVSFQNYHRKVFKFERNL